MLKLILIFFAVSILGPIVFKDILIGIVKLDDRRIRKEESAKQYQGKDENQ